MSSKPKVFREAQAAKLMDISPQTLARWRREGKVRHYRKFGRLIKYTLEDVDANIAETSNVRPRLMEARPVTEARFG